MDKFETEMQKAYACAGDSLFLGAGLFEESCYPDVKVEIPFKMLNRHGLISGATGTGKTKTIELLAGELIEKGIPAR